MIFYSLLIVLYLIREDPFEVSVLSDPLCENSRLFRIFKPYYDTTHLLLKLSNSTGSVTLTEIYVIVSHHLVSLKVTYISCKTYGSFFCDKE